MPNERYDQLKAEGLAAAVTPFTGEDTGAPHGRERTGTAKPKPPGTSRRPANKASVNTGKDYTEQILGLFQLPAGALAVAGMQNPIYAADARTITIYSPGIAAALNELANERPEVAAALERVLTVGPYGAVLAACVPMVLQLLTNHGRIPPGTAGTVAPQQLIADLVAEAEAAQQGNGQVVNDDVPGTG